MIKRQITLYQCQFCDVEIQTKKALRDHESNDHSPRWNGDKIHLSAGDIVILLVKDTHGSWEKYHKSHSKNTHISFKDGGKRLEEWENDNGIEFVMGCNDVESYRVTDETLQTERKVQ